MTAVLPRTAPPPLLPRQLWTGRVAEHMTVHAYAGNHTCCGLLTRDGYRTPAVETIRLDAVWCAACWPGRRCYVCGAPSGSWTQCRTCFAALDRAEHARDAVDGWDVA